MAKSPSKVVLAARADIEAAAFTFGKADGIVRNAIATLAGDIKGLTGPSLLEAQNVTRVGYAMGRLAKDDATAASADLRAQAVKLYATPVAKRTTLQTQIYNGAGQLWKRALATNNMAAIHSNGRKAGSKVVQAPKATVADAHGAAVVQASPDVAVTPRVLDRLECRKWIGDVHTKLQGFANLNAASMDGGLIQLVTSQRIAMEGCLARLYAADAAFEAEALAKVAATAPAKAKRAKK